MIENKMTGTYRLAPALDDARRRAYSAALHRAADVLREALRETPPVTDWDRRTVSAVEAAVRRLAEIAEFPR